MPKTGTNKTDSTEKPIKLRENKSAPILLCGPPTSISDNLLSVETLV